MTARHQQVADDLRRLIASGTLVAGERLSSEAVLAERYRVSVPTLRDALELLRAEGLIEKFHGRGNFVRRPAEPLTYPGGPVNGLHLIASSAEIAATAEVAAHLLTPPDSPVTEYVCVSHRGDSPQSLAHIYVPRAVVSRAVRQPSKRGSPWGDDLFADMSAVSSTDQVTARFPTAAEAQSLRIAARTPVLAVHRTVTAAGGQVLAYALLVLPGVRAQVAFVTRIDKKEAVG